MGEQWIPVIYRELTRHNYVESLTYGSEILRITLLDHDNEKKRITISFQSPVLLYRSTNESYAFGRIDAMMKGKENTTLYVENTVFKVINSEYIKELSVFSPALKQNPSIIHFALIPTDWVIDVIATQEPVVEYAYQESC